jgi:predicted esterase
MAHIHRYIPPKGDDTRTLLILHGTGGDENDLLPLGEMLAPEAGMLSPRGNVLENGAPRFFRRLAEGVFDLEDLHERTLELAAFVAESAEQYKFDPSRVIAVGFSNGANVAASMMLESPKTLRAAVLFRAMVPFVPEKPVDLAGVRVFMGSGLSDPIIPRDNSAKLAEMLEMFGADVTLEWQPGGHALTRPDVSLAYDWLESAGTSG